MRVLFLCLTLLGLAACQNDETGSGPIGAKWVLTEIDGQPFDASATLEFGADGAISGQAPCNLYHGTNSASYPALKFGPLAATRRACPDLNAEQTFLNALSAMTNATVSGDMLTLSNKDGRQMAFSRQP